MKKKVLIFILLLLLAGGAAAAVWYFRFREKPAADIDPENVVFVDSVAAITGLGGNGVQNRFSGVVEAQKTVGVEVASGMSVDETYVAVGQEVSVGTKLFSYNTEEAQNNITQLEIDIEDRQITIESTRAQIKQLEKEREKVSADEKLSYTTQIMSAENSIKRSEYEQKSKQAELEALKQRVANAVVTSELDGVVKSINRNNSGSSSDDSYGGTNYDSSDENANAYITIMATGEYRIKGTMNEQNTRELAEGMDMIAHSRVDESLTWKGVLSTIDRDNPVQNNNNFYSSSDSSTTSSSYPFYVDLEDSSGLMLGQHVYVEPDYGQSEERDGMWLDYYYLITDEDEAITPYVWAASEKDTLERREVRLGEYDEDMEQYEILSGLSAEDYIAVPDETYQEGMPVSRNIDQMGSMGYDDMEYEDTLMDGMEVYDDGGMEVYDDGMEVYDDGGMEMYDDVQEVYDADMEGMDGEELFDDSAMSPMDLLEIGGEAEYAE